MKSRGKVEHARPAETWDSLKAQLSHRQMLALARAVESWAAKSNGTGDGLERWAATLRGIAEEVGPDWNPPPPATPTLSHFLAEMTLRLQMVRDPNRRVESRVRPNPILPANDRSAD